MRKPVIIKRLREMVAFLDYLRQQTNIRDHKTLLIMQQQENLKTLLNDLVKINNDRVAGYQKAFDATDDADLQILFKRLQQESEEYSRQLNAELLKLGDEPQTDSTMSGKLYRTWMDMKIAFTGEDRYAILSSCEYGEDAIKRAYEEALKSDTAMPYTLRELIASQAASLRKAHDTIKASRDVEKINH